MATAASYILNIKDITYVSGTVEMNVQLGNFVAQSTQSVSDVTNELLSEVTAPGYFGATIADVALDPTSVLYIPYYGDCFLKSATCDEGFQYAVSYMHTNLMNNSPLLAASIAAICQYSYNGNDWYDASNQSIAKISVGFEATEDIYDSLYASFIIPGNVNPVAIWTRWKIVNTTGATIWLKSYSVSMDIIPRHTHVWVQTGQADNKLQSQQVDNTSLIGATPETITCTINGGTAFSIACASPSFNNSIDILGKATAMGKPLVSGVNTIVFTSTTKCSVTPTATYMALPT